MGCENLAAKFIDFDVSTFYNKKYQHIRHVGTMGFMAPEIEHIYYQRKQLKIHKSKINGYDQRIDFYSAGVLLGCLLLGIEEADVDDHDEDIRSGKGMIRFIEECQINNYESDNFVDYQLTPDIYDNREDDDEYDIENLSPKKIKDRHLPVMLTKEEKETLKLGHNLVQDY